ncbi:hypothetical protein ACVW0P_003708 [Mucilaginibacter sp. UYNi724]
MEDNKDLIQLYQTKLAEVEPLAVTYTKLVTLYKKHISELSVNEITSPSIIKEKGDVAKPIYIKKAKSKIANSNQLLNLVISILNKDKIPYSAEHFRIEYNKVTYKEITVTNFSPRISQLKKRGIVKIAIIEGAPIKEKFLYGLPEWFNGESLKPEYIEKIKAGQIQLY